jgi:hypothetical protein
MLKTEREHQAEMADRMFPAGVIAAWFVRAEDPIFCCDSIVCRAATRNGALRVWDAHYYGIMPMEPIYLDDDEIRRFA